MRGYYAFMLRYCYWVYLHSFMVVSLQFLEFSINLFGRFGRLLFDPRWFRSFLVVCSVCMSSIAIISFSFNIAVF